MNAVKWIIIFLLMFIIIWFAIENADQRVTVRLFKTVFTDVPLVLVMFESFIVGIILCFVVSLFQNVKLKMKLKSLNHEYEKLRKEVAELKGIDVKEVTEEPEENDINEDEEN